MTTARRDSSVKAGKAPKHHGHNPAAVKAVEAEEKANQTRQETGAEPQAKGKK